jgi:hypothetical protein
VIFGIDIFVLLFALFRLIADRLNLSEEIRKWVRAVLLTACTALALLQGMGLILGPTCEVWVQFAATLLAVFLGAMGYGDDVLSFLGAVRALGDLIKARAMFHMGRIAVDSEDDAARLLQRYVVKE